jgi:hypothetical protein
MPWTSTKDIEKRSVLFISHAMDINKRYLKKKSQAQLSEHAITLTKD